MTPSTETAVGLKPDWSSHGVPKDIARLWMECGGNHHGPRVEHVTMPMSNLVEFVRSLAALRPGPVPEVRERESTDAGPLLKRLKDISRRVQAGKRSKSASMAPLLDAINALPDTIALVEAIDFERDIAFEQAEVAVDHARREKADADKFHAVWEAAEARVSALEGVLKDVRAAITNDNGLNGESIVCTVWVSLIETAVDRIDAALAP